jgi:integrative and conjugative element protein (TIGR02256 family)
MALRLKFWGKLRSGNGLIGRLSGSDQRVQLDQRVLEHFKKWQQHGSRATEAGGQIFGLISSDRVQVKIATGPYRGDERERFHYRSDPRKAQHAIDNQGRRGLLYLGEWHTHAEDIPVASISDREAIKTLRARSTICTSSVLLVIVGRSEPAVGVSVYSIDAKYKLEQWSMLAS